MIAPAVFLKERILGKVAFFLFLLSLPLSIRKVFFVFSPDGSGGFNEYTDISLYLSDILLLLTLCILLLENRSVVLSISWWKQLFHVEQFKILFFTPVLFLLWSGVSIFWSKSYFLGTYSFSRLVLGYFLYAYVLLHFVPRGTFDSENKDCSTWNIWRSIALALIFGGFFQAILAILQFTFQSSLGLSFLKESIFSSSDTGVAKIILAQESLIRAYGLFPHPNVLAGFLGVTILFTSAYPLIFRKRLFHVEQLPEKIKSDKNEISLSDVPRGTEWNVINWIKDHCSTWNNENRISRMFHVEQFSIAYRVVLSVQIIGFLLTFSKSAFLGLLISLGYFVYRLFHVEQISLKSEIVPRGTISTINSWIQEKCSTWNNKDGISKMFHVEQLLIFSKGLFLMLFVGMFLGMVNWQYFLIQPFKERIFLEKSAWAVLQEHPFLGTGIGQSVFVMQDFFSEKLLAWQFQPIHNVFLLIFSETGFIGLFLFLSLFIFMIVPRGTIAIFFVWAKQKLFHVEQWKKSETDFGINVPRGTLNHWGARTLIEAVCIFLGVISLFDHYLWDIQQGQWLLWLSLGLLSSSRLFIYDIDKK